MPDPSLEDACPAEDDIAAFLRGRLAAARTRALESHVAGCPACRRLLSALARAAATESRPVTVDSLSATLPLDAGGGDGELPLGARFGRYVVLDWLGAGGMGVVYSAYDPELSRKLALKVLRSDRTASAGPAPRHDVLLREAQAMAQLAHPNVVTVFDTGSVEGRVYIAMELVEGTTLARWLAAERRTRGEILATFVAAGSGLAAAHAAGLIHRDFKPDNVLIGHDGRVRVTDFGLARAAPSEPGEPGEPGAAPPAHAVGTPQTGRVGTLAYMAPEQYFQRSADARADQFSFAVALYEALYGERPFPPQRFAADPAQPPAITPPRDASVPARLRQVLLRALRPDPDQRYPSMAALLTALAPRPRRGPRIALGALAAAAVIASAAGYAIHLRQVADQRAELVGRLRGAASELRTQLRTAHMLPRHDIRPAREDVRRVMRDVERQRDTPRGREESALIDFVLGEGYRALGDREHALPRLEAAWQAGERGPHIDLALGHMLGAAYEDKVGELERMVPSSRRDAELRGTEQRYRDPAMAHLRAALAASAGSAAYLEALIAFHSHRFAESSRLAHAAFAESPTFYEAGELDARAHNEAGRALLAADRSGEADAEFATARQIFAHVLEIARSDDDAWLAYGEMVYAQAHALARGELPDDLRRQTLDALHTMMQINPERSEPVLYEAQIYEQEANIAIIAYRDPGPAVDQLLALCDQARARGADTDEIDVFVCLAHWERAVYQGSHGIDPRPAFQHAIAACERAVAARPGTDKYASLGAVYSSLAAYDAEHGADPSPVFELGAKNLRAAIAIGDDAVLHHNLGRLWTNLARYREGHGQSPDAAVDQALAEFETSVRMDATRADAWAGMADALIARARFQQAAHADTGPAVTSARAHLARAIAAQPTLVAPIRYRILLAELEAEALLERHADPGASIADLRAAMQELLRRPPENSFVHRAACRTELFAARWALAQHQAADPLLARAASEAARAREADPMDALAWTASAEVEAVRAAALQARGDSPAAAIARGRELLARALQIDPTQVRTLAVRDALAAAQPTR